MSLILLGSNVNSVSAESSGNASLPLGCTSTQGYSPITGAKCDSVIVQRLPLGCTSREGYSPITGVKCDSGKISLPPGCASISGFSITTGLPCSTQSQSITILSPNGGEIFQFGGKLTGAFYSNGLSVGDTYEVALINGNGLDIGDIGYGLISSTSSDKQSISVTIPNNVASGKYRMRLAVCATSNRTIPSGTCVQDQSDSYFTINSSSPSLPPGCASISGFNAITGELCSGIKVALVGTPTAVKIAGEVGGTPPGDSGTFTVNFDVTAFGADMYIDATAPDATGGTTESDVDVTGAGTLTCTMTSPSGATLSTSYLVRETETERFAVTCDIRDGATDLVDGFFDVLLTNLAYAITDAQTVNIDYTFDLSDFKTPQIFLNDNEDNVTIPSITVLNPNGGETWNKGQTYNIAWRSRNLDKVAIYALSGGQRYVLATGVDARAGTYSFTVPTTWPNNRDYKIYVSNESTYVNDSSDGYFTVTVGTISGADKILDSRSLTANAIDGTANSPAAENTSGAKSFYFTRFLEEGSSGNEVMELQKSLNKAGYDAGNADGKFGLKTKEALMKFQTANGLKSDGIAGYEVRTFLNR